MTTCYSIAPFLNQRKATARGLLETPQIIGPHLWPVKRQVKGAIFQKMENFGGGLRFLRSFFGIRTPK
jgi:hypothetical protein